MDNGSQGGTHWTSFIKNDNKPQNFDKFGGQPDNILIYQLLKQIVYHSHKIQDTNFKLCGSYCLYFFYIIRRMKFYDTTLKMSFRYLNVRTNVFGIYSNNSENKVDTSLIVQTLYLRRNYIEAKIEEDLKI